MALTPVTILFAAGQSDGIASKLLPNGLFERVVNGRYRQDGALGVRRGWQPLDMSTIDTAAPDFDAFDLYSHGENLVALGSRGSAYPTDLYVFTDAQTASPWRGLGTPDDAGMQSGAHTQVIGGLPYSAGTVETASVAVTEQASGKKMCAATIQTSDGASDDYQTLHVFDPDTDETLIMEVKDLGDVGTGGTFVGALSSTVFVWIRRVDVNITMELVSFATTPPSIAATVNLANDSQQFFQARVDATRIHLLYRVASSNTIRYRQFNHAGTQQGADKTVYSATSVVRFGFAISATQVHAAVVVNATTISLLTFGISSPFTTAQGPTSVTAIEDINDALDVQVYSTSIKLAFTGTTTSTTKQSLHVMDRSIAAHAAGTTRSFPGFLLRGGMIVAGADADCLLIPTANYAWKVALIETATGGVGANALLKIQGDGRASVVYYEDQSIAGVGEAGGNRGGTTALDADGYVYLSQNTATEPNALKAGVRRVQIEQPGRRQGATLAGLLYIAGGQLAVSDGRQLVESGMPPPRLENTVQGTTGALTQLGEYKYRAHWEWYDWQSNKHLSPVSDEVTVTLTGLNDSVTFDVAVPQTLRAFPVGDALASNIRLKLFRTETNLNGVPASYVISPGTAQLLNIAAGTLDISETASGNRLRVTVNGGAPVDVNFAAGDTNLQAVGLAITTQVSGLTFTVNDAQTTLTLTTIATGTAASIFLGTNGVGAPFIAGMLGVSFSFTATGTQDAEAGELFFLAKSVQSSDSPARISITDTASDASLIVQETLYTTGDRGAVSGVLDFAPPKPSSYVAVTRDRVVLADERGLVQMSQKAFPFEAIAFVDPGLVGPVGFAYQARIDGQITGLAAIDDSIVVGTRDELYLIAGEGPNYVGVGEFTVPTRLPSETGFYDWRSIALTSEGLWFQGDVDKLYMLPRGGGVPTEDTAIEGRISSAIVGAATSEGDIPTVVMATAERLLVRDIQRKQWMEDTVPFTPITLLEHKGRFFSINSSDKIVWGESTTSYNDNASHVVLSLTTGTVAPFGMDAWGRLGGVTVLASAIGTGSATLQAEISYDEGITWISMGTQTVTTPTADSAVRVEFCPIYQRGDRFKFRFTMTPTGVATNRGLDLHGFTLWLKKARGIPRFDASKRH